MKFTIPFAILLLQQSALAARPAQWSDWEAVKDHFFERIQDSTCPDAGSEDLKSHWDYDYDGYRSTMSEEEALNQDCTLFHRFRNPAPLGTRLIRHAFHDAAGGFNGFLNIHDLVENPALHSTMIVLRDDYDTLEVPNGEGAGTVPIKQIISFADFTAWAAHAALLRTVNIQNRTDRTGQRQITEEPNIQVRVGRPTYEPTSPNDHGPAEYFPTGLGPQGTGQLIVDYFANEFGFTAEETVTIMGAHTLGGGRREDSGFSGMWTQSKGKFNNDYQKQLVFPLPLVCLDPTNCGYYSEAGDNIMADISLKQQCVSGEDSDRCHGWQQTMRKGMGDIPDKFQWQHSCKDDGTGCTHLMLNIDIGLFYNLEGYICTAEDEATGVPATAGRTCKEGMIKGYPSGSSCSLDDTRVLATCFEPNQETNDYISIDADDQASWVQEFGPLFDRLTTHKMMEGKTVDDLTVLTADSSESNCRNDGTWAYTTAIRPNGSGGEVRTCNWVVRDSASRCDLVGDDGIPAYEACCGCEGPGRTDGGGFGFLDPEPTASKPDVTESPIEAPSEPTASQSDVTQSPSEAPTVPLSSGQSQEGMHTPGTIFDGSVFTSGGQQLFSQASRALSIVGAMLFLSL